jgi:hypothetical protein
MEKTMGDALPPFEPDAVRESWDCVAMESIKSSFVEPALTNYFLCLIVTVHIRTRIVTVEGPRGTISPALYESPKPGCSTSMHRSTTTC